MPENRPPRRRPALRELTGGWLPGSGSRARAGYPGERLGLPRSGRGSLAPPGARLGALLADLVLSSLVGALLVRPASLAAEQTWNLVSVGVFVLGTGVQALASGRTAGMRLAGLQIVRLDGGRVGPRIFFRQLLVALLIPALIWNRDQRGLHDQACNTAVVRVS